MNPTSKISADAATDAGWRNWLHVIAGILALCLIGSYLFSWPTLPVNANSTALGAFGDYMGGLLNPLISLFTLIIAMKVWGLQKTELLETRKAVEEQAKTAEQQRQEQRFFDLLNIYHRTIDSTTYLTTWERQEVRFQNGSPRANTVTESVHLRGKEALATRIRDLMNGKLFKIDLERFSQKNNLYREDDAKHIHKNQKIDWDDNEHAKLLDSYFRVVFHILAELEKTLGDQHDRYAKLFLAQLSRAELHLLGLHLWLGDEGSKIRPLAEKYALLEHLPQDDLRSILQYALPKSVFTPPLATTDSEASATSAAPIVATQETPHAD